MTKMNGLCIVLYRFESIREDGIAIVLLFCVFFTHLMFCKHKTGSFMFGDFGGIFLGDPISSHVGLSKVHCLAADGAFVRV